MTTDIKGGKGLQGPDKRQGELRDQPTDPRASPEGLDRPRTHPLGKERGRADAPPADQGRDEDRAVGEGS